MTDAQHILKLIESVDPSDVAAMDELDLRVACYVQHHDYGSDSATFLLNPYPDYSSSRDALKRIRPEGWKVAIHFGDTIWEAIISRNGFGVSFDSGQLPTEELAELHSIIQAIQYERERA